MTPSDGKKMRKFLNTKLHFLNDFIADVDALLTEMETEYFRVTIFGSARIKPDSEIYAQVEQLAFELAGRRVDVVTGGGPGLMEAANKGAIRGQNASRSIGLAIELPFESDANAHLDVKRQHRRFSSRLDEFMRISHATVVTQGGIGTVLELFYTWQLLQVGHTRPRPVLLLGRAFWSGMLDWLRDEVLPRNLISQRDLTMLTIVDSVDEVIASLLPHITEFQKRSASERIEAGKVGGARPPGKRSDVTPQ